MPTLTSSPSALFVGLAAMAAPAAASMSGSSISEALLLGAGLGLVFAVVGGVLSLIEFPLVGQCYTPQVFRPFEGFTKLYMALHPFLIGQLVAAGWLITAPGFASLNMVPLPPAATYTAMLVAAGSAPIYTLGFASFQMDPKVTLAWQAHTALQYAAAALFLQHMAPSPWACQCPSR